MVGDLADLSVKVLISNLVLTRTEVQQHTHIKYVSSLRERIVKSLEQAVLILLTVVCLNSSLKRDEANSLYEDNKPTGHQGQTHIYTHMIYIYKHTHIRRFLLEFSSSSENKKLQ